MSARGGKRARDAEGDAVAVFWHMGDAASEDDADRPGLINRSWVELRQYRDDAMRLGYKGEVLDRLVQRWQDLLAQARRGR